MVSGLESLHSLFLGVGHGQLFLALQEDGPRDLPFVDDVVAAGELRIEQIQLLLLHHLLLRLFLDLDDLRESCLAVANGVGDAAVLVLLIEHILQFIKIIDGLIEALSFAGDGFEHRHVYAASEGWTVFLWAFLNSSSQRLRIPITPNELPTVVRVYHECGCHIIGQSFAHILGLVLQ